jgi:hypothetical protein
MEAKDLRLIMTCGECPEQYDVVYHSKILGYLHYRWDLFEVNIYSGKNRSIYVKQLGGEFDGKLSDEKRDTILKEARDIIAGFYSAHPEEMDEKNWEKCQGDMDEDPFTKL